MLASLFYKHKRFHECIDVLNYGLSKCSPDKIKLHSDNSFSEQTIFRKMKDAIGLLSTCQHLLIESVQFHAPFCLLPVELTPVLKLFDEDFLMFPPVVYLKMLQFLCLHHLGDSRGKRNSLRELELTVRELYFIENESYFKIAKTCLHIAKCMM